MRDADGRYEAIRRELLGHRGFSVLDLGAHTGYFAHRLAEEFGARVAAVDKTRGLEARPGVTVYREYWTADQLADVGEGVFDVTLLLSVLHHMVEWRRALAAVVGFSPVAFVELPDPREVLPNAASHGEAVQMHQAVQAAGGVVVGWSPGYDSRFNRPTYVIGRLG